MRQPTTSLKRIYRAIDRARQTHTMVVLHPDTAQWLCAQIEKREALTRKLAAQMEPVGGLRQSHDDYTSAVALSARSFVAQWPKLPGRKKLNRAQRKN